MLQAHRKNQKYVKKGKNKFKPFKTKTERELTRSYNKDRI